MSDVAQQHLRAHLARNTLAAVLLKTLSRSPTALMALAPMFCAVWLSAMLAALPAVGDKNRHLVERRVEREAI